MPITAELLTKRCRHPVDALDDKQIAAYLCTVEGWRLDQDKIIRAFDFKNYYRTMAFVNAIAYIFHTEDHHPELIVSYKRCIVKLNTHSVNGGRGGLSENDFICAAKVNGVYDQSVMQA